MRAWVRVAGCAVVLSCLTSTTHAGLPTSPGRGNTCSHVPTRIVLVGSDGVLPDTTVGAFDVTVCEFPDPLPGASVAVEQSTNTLGVRLGALADPPSTCGVGVRFFTDAEGHCRATITGSVDLSQQVPDIAPTVRIFANAVWFGDVPVVCYDLDGSGGVGSGDLSKWLGLFATGQNYLVADYDGDGKLGAGDLSLWLGVYASGRETVSATRFCP